MATKTKNKVTPLMKQYMGVKQEHPDALLLFRVGDFYETFGEDAITVSKVLGIVLTARNNGGSKIELAGFPYHSVDVYLPKLVKAGFRVAVCEQLEKPSKEKKIVKRGVTDIVTPGVTFHDNILDHKENNFLCSIHYDGDHHGISFLDISTGEFLIAEGGDSLINKLIQSFNPSEIIFSRSKSKEIIKLIGDDHYSFPLEEWIYQFEYTREKLLDHFEVNSLKGFGIEEMKAGQVAAGGILHYLGTTENKSLDHLVRINRIQTKEFMWLDRFTIRNLELINSNHPTGTPLIRILDQCISPMGSRLLRKWVLLPLINPTTIKSRLDTVEFLFNNTDQLEELEEQLKGIGDLERITARLAAKKINPKEIKSLERSLKALGPIKEMMSKSGQSSMIALSDTINLCSKLQEEVFKTLTEDPPAVLSKGQVIKDGFNSELDEWRDIIKNGKQLLVDIQTKEAEATGISNLKIGFNNVFGYYLEVTNRYKDQGLIPDNWIRKQTLTNSERYITEELKTLENKILSAQEKIAELESKFYDELLEIISNYIEPILQNAKIVAQVDCLRSFARLAIKNKYVRPDVNEELDIKITEGRHPVIEQELPAGEPYIPNDLDLSNKDTQIIMITGPNMSGKSAILRQTALICLMAQMGSFVPAKEAQIGYVDKLFTRVGASDNISSGESTFMVEMIETSSILNNISERSLILLDEIGRGTSTYDGISIAWSIASYLHDNPSANPKTLFATHYHELNELAVQYPRIKNYNVATKEVGNKVLFLRKLVEGGSNHSFGLHVAKMAGMPKSILAQAEKLLAELEKKSLSQKQEMNTALKNSKSPQQAMQLSFFNEEDERWIDIKKEFEAIEIDGMTPIECMLKLKELEEIFKGK